MSLEEELDYLRKVVENIKEEEKKEIEEFLKNKNYTEQSDSEYEIEKTSEQIRKEEESNLLKNIEYSLEVHLKQKFTFKKDLYDYY